MTGSRIVDNAEKSLSIPFRKQFKRLYIIIISAFQQKFCWITVINWCKDKQTKVINKGNLKFFRKFSGNISSFTYESWFSV